MDPVSVASLAVSLVGFARTAAKFNDSFARALGTNPTSYPVEFTQLKDEINSSKRIIANALLFLRDYQDDRITETTAYARVLIGRLTQTCESATNLMDEIVSNHARFLSKWVPLVASTHKQMRALKLELLKWARHVTTSNESLSQAAEASIAKVSLWEFPQAIHGQPIRHITTYLAESINVPDTTLPNHFTIVYWAPGNPWRFPSIINQIMPENLVLWAQDILARPLSGFASRNKRFDTTNATHALLWTCLAYNSPTAVSRNSESWSTVLFIDYSQGMTNPVSYAFIAGMGYSPTGDDQSIELTRSIRNMRRSPISFVLILIEQQAATDISEVARHAKNIYAVEKKTRFYVLDDEDALENSDYDLQELTTALNSAISRLAFHEMRLDANLIVIDAFCEALHDTDFHPDYFKDIIDNAKWYANRLRARLKAIRRDLMFHKEVARTQLQVVYTLVSQRDTRITLKLTEASVEIAKDSKSDSSVMKTLTLFSALFLPGTFISAMFSMTMFNWSAPIGEPVVSNRFWIYWAVTVPLTMLLILGWIMQHNTLPGLREILPKEPRQQASKSG